MFEIMKFLITNKFRLSTSNLLGDCLLVLTKTGNIQVQIHGTMYNYTETLENTKSISRLIVPIKYWEQLNRAVKIEKFNALNAAVEKELELISKRD